MKRFWRNPNSLNQSLLKKGKESSMRKSVTEVQHRDCSQHVAAEPFGPGITTPSCSTRQRSGFTHGQYFPNERKRGSLGFTLPVTTNYVAMEKQPDFCLKQYRVDFSPMEDQTIRKKQLLAVHTQKLGSYTFDGAMLYKTQELPANCLRLLSKAKDEAYTITLRYVGEIHQNHPSYIQFYNTVMRKCQSLLGFEELGRHFYNPNKRILIRESFLELWPGYITAIRNHDAGILLCAEVTHKVLRTTTVLDLIRDLLGKNNTVQRGQEAIRKEVVGQIVITHYNRKTYRIDDIDFNSTPRAVFQTKGEGDAVREITYLEYYRNRYGIDISDDDILQPMLISHPRKKDLNKGMTTDIYLVPSICNLTGLSESQRKNFRLMQQLAEHLHMNPAVRKAKLEEFMNEIKSNQAVSKEFANWDVEFNPEFLRANARVLPVEKIQFGSRTAGIFVIPKDFPDWTQDLKRNFMLSRRPLREWLLYVPEECKVNVSRFVGSMREQCDTMGMGMANPLMVSTYVSKTRIDEQQLGKPLIDYHGRVTFVIVILPNNQLQRYAAVKKFFVLRHGIAIQCFLSKNFESNNYGSIINKMMIQVNAKLGGVPWSVELPFKTKVMILGYDVYHCAERKNESVGALVATLSPDLGRYFSVVSFHKDKSELSNNMCIDTKKCLEAFKRENGVYPDRILLFRDGVGEGQIQFVVEQEVKMMEAGINEVYSSAGLKSPKFTFTIVTKKINTRYFASNKSLTINPPPGSVLDEVITLPGRFDYFLVSQTVRQGTVSPTSYNIIYDNSGVTANSMQQLTFKLCHLYFNWSGTVAVPAPCQFAHKLAYLTGIALNGETPPQLSTVLWYL